MSLTFSAFLKSWLAELFGPLSRSLNSRVFFGRGTSL